MNCCCSFSEAASASSRAFRLSATARASAGRSSDGIRSRGRRSVSTSRAFSFSRAGAATSGARSAEAVEEAHGAVTRRGRRRLAHAVPDAANGLDQLLPVAAVDLLAQRVDVHVDDVGREIERVLPDARLDLGARDHLAAPPQEQLEERALAHRQPHGLPAAHDLARLGVVREVVEREGPGLDDLGAPQERADARQQLPEREGLDQVVVGAGVEPLDLVLDGVAGREHEDLRVHAARAQLAAELEAVARARQHQVEDDEVRRRGHDLFEPRVGIARHVDRIALLGQPLLQELGDPLLVLDDDDLHRGPSSGPGPVGGRPRGPHEREDEDRARPRREARGERRGGLRRGNGHDRSDGQQAKEQRSGHGDRRHGWNHRASTRVL